jgi:hypothetical protein
MGSTTALSAGAGTTAGPERPAGVVSRMVGSLVDGSIAAGLMGTASDMREVRKERVA